MTTDDMEISYEGHGDDDIDINIDIEPGNHDEDFIIEDARSEAGTNDDVMLDEDNASYNMEDADYVPEEELQDIIDAEPVEVTELEMLRPDETDIHTFPSEAIPSPIQSEDRYVKVNPADDTASYIQDAQVEQQQPEETPNIVAEVTAQPTPSPEAEATLQKASQPESDGKPQEVEKINVQTPPHVPGEQEQGETSGTDEPEQTTSKEHDLISEERNILVAYQGSEYTLVASSESDDPDSYFLRDPSVLKEPLSALFTVLRDILHDEIPRGEELILTVVDLGLEARETSATNTEITFSQIVDLHTTLVRNDGESKMPPLFISLETKPNFTRFYANLVEDARQGKGLHEVTGFWGETDDADVWPGLEEYEEEESSHLDGTDADGSEQVENVEQGNDEWTEVGTGQKISSGSPSLETSTDEKPSATSDAERAGTDQVTGVADQDALSNELNQPWTEKHDAESNVPEANSSNEEDEGGDFIDYEDEDYAQNDDEVEAASKQENTNHDQSDEVSTAEYQKTNEGVEMSRRSSSRTVDIGNNTEATTQQIIDAPGDADGLVEAEYDLNTDANGNTGQQTELAEGFETVTDEHEHQENGDHEEAQYGENEGEAQYGDNEGEAEYDDEVGPSYYDGNEDGSIQEQDDGAEHGEEFSHIQETVDGVQPGEEFVDIQETDDGAGQDEGFDQNSHDVDISASDVQNNENTEFDDGGEISYEDGEDDVDGSLSAVADTGETEDKSAVADLNQNHNEEKDEIDYEDDEEEVSLFEGSGPTTPAKLIATGKRPHEEDGDAIDIGSQEAKRPRS